MTTAGQTADKSRDLRRLLEKARNAVDIWERRAEVLSLLDVYRTEVLESPEPTRILEVIPIAQRLLAFYGTQEYARQFLQTTAQMLSSRPELAAEFNQALLRAELDPLEQRKRWTQSSLAFSVFALIAAAIGLVAIGLTLVFPQLPQTGIQVAGAVVAAVGLLLAAFYYIIARIRRATIEAEIQNVERKAQIRAAIPEPTALSAVSGAGGVDYFSNLVRINVSNLSDYYTQVRVHTNNSFWASIAAGTMGFVLVCVGIAIGFGSSSHQSISYVTTASGVVVEFISGIFFYLYNRTVRQLKSYHDSLLDVQNILLAFRIVEQSGGEQRRELLDQILKFLLQKRREDRPTDSGRE